MGDVTFLHDATALVLGPDEPRPDLTIVVANDDGGSIFATLEQGAPSTPTRYDRLFGTPHGVDLAACAPPPGRRTGGSTRWPSSSTRWPAQRRHRGRRGRRPPRQPARARPRDPSARPA